MLEIINQIGQVLQLEDQVSLPVERNNMLFNDSDTLLQDIVYNLTVPLSPSNKIFIAHGHLVDAKNDVYEMPIKANLQAYPFFTGILNYTIKNNKIELKLKPNFASITSKITNNLISDIDFGDALDDMTVTAYQALMKDTCVNPQNYPYVFCPVYNTRLGEGNADITAKRDYINFWDYATQTFIANAFATTFKETRNSPYPKVLAILKQIAEAIGCKITGDWQNSAQAQNIYVENVKADFGTSVSSILPGLYPSAFYLPDITMADFLKQTKERLHLSFDFDFNKKIWQIESFETALKKPVIALENFIDSLTEINVPTTKGYNVSLKVEEKDTNWNSGTTDEPDYKPRYSLLIAEAKKEKKLVVGTLLVYQNGTKQSVKSELLYKDFVDLGNATNRPEVINPLRFFIYEGMQLLEAGKYWPQSNTFDLSLTEVNVYQFLNYAKQYRFTANIPNLVLSSLNSTSIISFITKEGTYVKAIIEKLSFDLKASSQYTKCDILCRNVAYLEKTKAILKDNYAAINAVGNSFIDYKSNLKGLLPTVKLILADPGATTITLETPENKLPCDKYGLDGAIVPVKIPAGTDFMDYFSNLTLKFSITQGIPKELRIGVKRIPFVLQPSGAYEASIPYQSGSYYAYFIVY